MERTISFSLRDILAAAASGQIRVPAEAAGALILAAAEQLKQRPRQVVASDLVLEPTGSLTINSNAPADPCEADAALRALLEQLLEHTSSESVALRRLASAAPRGASELVSELVAALLPFNRGAARRGLARLHRRLRETPAPLPNAAAGSSEARAVPRAAPRELSEDELPAPTLLKNDSSPGERWGASLARTPIFGSLPVASRPLGTEPDPDPTDIDVVSREVASPSDSDDVFHRTPPPSEVYDRAKPPARTPVYHDPESVIIEDEDSVVARNPALPAPGAPILGTFTPRRSDVGALLGEFGVGESATDRELSAKLRVSVGVNADSTTPITPSVKSRTPPPVQFGAPAAASQKGQRAPWLLASVFTLSLCGAWLLRPAAEATVGGVEEECSAVVEVRADPGVEVRLVNALQRLRMTGPSAVFRSVGCAEDAEVIVVLNDAEPEEAEGAAASASDLASKEPRSGGWLRVPVPKHRLRSAADSGKPLVISVFGR